MRVYIGENDILYGQDQRWTRGIPVGVWNVEDLGTLWKLTAPGYGDKSGLGYGNGALYVSKEGCQECPGFPVVETTQELHTVLLSGFGGSGACRGGHVFHWLGNSTNSKPHPSLTCECGALSYGDAMSFPGITAK